MPFLKVSSLARTLATGAYERLSKLSKDYAYMGAITEVADKLDDLDYMLNESASYIAGDPDELVKQLKRAPGSAPGRRAQSRRKARRHRCGTPSPAPAAGAGRRP